MNFIIIFFISFSMGFFIALYETLTTKFKGSVLYNYLLKYPKILRWFYREGKGGENAIWLNKYKNDDPTQGEKFRGSSRYFIFLVDAWHFSKMMIAICIGSLLLFYGYLGSFELISSNHIFLNMIIDVILIMTVIIQSFNLFYTWLFPSKKPKLDRFFEKN